MRGIVYCLLSSLPLCVQADDTTLRSLDASPVLHYLLNRRGGAFAPTSYAEDNVNFTYLEHELAKAESRYSLTKREVNGNRLIRTAKSLHGSSSIVEGQLMGSLAENGTW